MVRDGNYDPRDLKGKKAKKAKVEPTDVEFLELFPQSWPTENPRDGLLNAKQIQDVLTAEGFDKNCSAEKRDLLMKQKKLEVITGLPRGEILAGLPAAVAAYKQWREGNICLEKATRLRKAAPKYDGS
jgi:hypothetical protein